MTMKDMGSVIRYGFWSFSLVVVGIIVLLAVGREVPPWLSGLPPAMILASTAILRPKGEKNEPKSGPPPEAVDPKKDEDLET
jgi:hypothetical protein